MVLDEIRGAFLARQLDKTLTLFEKEINNSWLAPVPTDTWSRSQHDEAAGVEQTRAAVAFVYLLTCKAFNVEKIDEIDLAQAENIYRLNQGCIAEFRRANYEFRGTNYDGYVKKLPFGFRVINIYWEAAMIESQPTWKVRNRCYHIMMDQVDKYKSVVLKGVEMMVEGYSKSFTRFLHD